MFMLWDKVFFEVLIIRSNVKFTSLGYDVFLFRVRFKIKDYIVFDRFFVSFVEK